MARRGRCRCGSLLKFRLGAKGYKTRCPQCGSVVRLRVQPGRPRKRPRVVQCSCGATVLAPRGQLTCCPRCQKTLPKGQHGVPAEAAAGPVLLPIPKPKPAHLAPGPPPTIPCPVCGVAMPARALQCPGCGTPQAPS